MARFHRVQLGSIYFTDNGLEAGLPCKVDVEGLPQLVGAYRGQTVLSAANVPHTFLAPSNAGRGAVLTINVANMTKTVFDAVVAALDGTVLGAAITLDVEGGSGNFAPSVRGYFTADEPPYRFGKFRGTIMQDVVFSVVVQ